MTKKDYIIIAQAIKNYNFSGISSYQIKIKHSHGIIKEIIKVLEADNPKFDAQKFEKACGLPLTDQERDCIRCEETFTGNGAHDLCLKCRKNINRIDIES